MPFFIVRQDLTKMEVDAIVNAANTDLQMGGGVCGAIFRAAGIEEMRAACDPLRPIQTGEAVITPGFRLPAKFVIHTAGPVYQDGFRGEERQLENSYRNSLQLAKSNGCNSIAFPLISSGIYGYPKAEALRVAGRTIQAFLRDNEMDVYLTVLDKETVVLSESLFGSQRIEEDYKKKGRRIVKLEKL